MYGRLISVLGEPMDQKGPLEAVERAPIRQPEMGTKVSVKKTDKKSPRRGATVDMPQVGFVYPLSQ